ncbi:MAG: DUF3999 domain-containing protein [Acidobacteriota bacterium]|nr:DUF3999 domain-containing protein [Acidobacteriota bacterium]
MHRLILSALIVSAAARADYDPANWRARRPLQVQAGHPVSSLRLDPGIYKSSLARLDDLRIVRSGAEVPYAIRIFSGSAEQVEFSPAMLNKARLADGNFQLTLDLDGHPKHSRLRIQTPDKNFNAHVRIETSDDARTWALARADGYVFDITQKEQHADGLSVDYPVSTRRYVRATLIGNLNVANAWIQYARDVKPMRETVASLTPAVAEDPKEHTTTITADIGYSGLPFDQVDLTVAPGSFSRTVGVETSEDAKEWTSAGSGVVYRSPEQENTGISVGEHWTRYLRLIVRNQDNAPLSIRGVTLSGNLRTLEFPSSTPGVYWLYSGNTTAKRPSYDFAQVLPDREPRIAATPGLEEPNPAYRAPVSPPIPWTDRHPNLLYAVLAAAILILGLISIRFLLRVRSSHT